MLVLVIIYSSNEIVDILVEHSPSYNYLISCGYHDADVYKLWFIDTL